MLGDDPKHLDARFNLGVLTFQAGATDEARHHLEKLREVAPKGSDLVPRLEGMLNGTPPPARVDAPRPAESAPGKTVVVTKTGASPSALPAR